MGRPTGWWSGPPHICSAGAAAASAARIGCRSGSTAYTAARAAAAPAAAPAARRRTGDRTALLRAGAGTGAGGIRGRSTADRAGRLSAAGIAAPLLDKVWEYEATEAAVAGISHFISLHKRSGNVCSRVILCRMCPMRVGKQKNPDGTRSSGFWIQKSKENSTLGELRRAASCLQAVLREFLSCFSLIFRAFLTFCFSVIRCADHKKRPFFIQRQADETHHLLPQTTPLVYCTSLLHKCP